MKITLAVNYHEYCNMCMIKTKQALVLIFELRNVTHNHYRFVYI